MICCKVPYNGLCGKLSSLSTCNEEVHDLIDDHLIRKFSWVAHKEGEKIGTLSDIALLFTSSSSLNEVVYHCPYCLAVLVDPAQFRCHSDSLSSQVINGKVEGVDGFVTDCNQCLVESFTNSFAH